MDRDFTEDDVATFEGWLRYQALDLTAMSVEEISTWRTMFDEVLQARANRTPAGRMKLPPLGAAEYRYAVAVRDSNNLWLVLWIRRSRNGEVFVMKPTGDRDWDIHTSYHRDGTLHMKSYGRRMISSRRQPPTGNFRGTEHLGTDSGFVPRGVGAICEVSDFVGVIEVPIGVLGLASGSVSVDLVEPGETPLPVPWTRIVLQEVFREVVPWLIVTIHKK